MRLRISKTDCHPLFLLFFLLLFSQSVPAQVMEVSNDPPITPINLISNVFLGEGVEVLSVEYEGSDGSVGLFKNGDAAIGLNRGIVITSGLAVTSGIDYGVDATGGNFASENNFSTASDPDLNAIASNTVNNVSKYVITFIPISDTLRFRYAFGSEEYPEFACTQYNDVFGFFISGPGINGPYSNNAENIALIPGTNRPVTINNVNPGVPGAAGGTVQNCSGDLGSLDYSEYYNDNNGTASQPVYDGYTDVFTAEAIVQPCSTYTIKLLIADVGDSAYDSGVFLEAKSFGTGSLNVDVNTLSLDGSVAEGCEPGFLTFSLPGPVEADFPIDFNIGGTAVNGVDYEAIPTELFIPAGDSSVTVPIYVIEDNIPEDVETILIDVQRDPCNRDTFQLNIRDNPLMPADLGPDIFICEGDSVQIDGTLPVPAPEPPSFSNTTPLNIATHNVPYFSNIEVSGVIPTVLSPDVIRSICIDSLDHRWIDDLDIYLITPGGQFLELSTDNGGNGGNNLGLDYFINTCFTVDATTPINFPGPVAGPDAPPFTGNWLPEGVWSDLWDGENPTNGTWQLQIIDDAFNITGTLYSWTITFNPLYDIFYSWEPATGLSCTDCPDPIVKPDVTTTYILTATDSYGCSVYDTITVEVLPNLEAPVVGCSGITDNSITFNWPPVTGATGYEVSLDGGVTWLPATGLNAHTVDGLSLNQEVTIQVRASGDCPGEVGIATCQTPDCTPPALNAVAADATCAGISNGTVTLTASGGAPPYEFSLDGTVSASGQFTGLAAGEYQALLIDANDCPASVLVTVGEASAIAVDSLLLNGTSCFGATDGSATLTVSGGTPPYTYTWSSGEADSIAQALPGGAAMVTVTDANGCLAVSQIDVPEPTELSLSFTTTAVSCAGAGDGAAVVTPAGGTAPYSFQWDANAGGPAQDTALSLSGGNYSVTVTDANGCEITGSTSVNEDSPIELTVSGADPACYDGADGTATVQAGGGAGGFTFEWSNGQAGEQATGLTTGDYFVIALDAEQCRDTAFVSLGQPDSLSVAINTAPPSCTDGADGQATLDVTGGTGAYSFEWNGQPGPGTGQRSDLTPGDYSVLVTDENGCSKAIDLTVDNAEPVELAFTSTIVSCNGGSDGTAMVTASGGAGGYTYQWDNGDAAETATGLSAGTAQVTVTDANGCQVAGEVAIEENTPVELNLTSADPLCFEAADGTASASASGGTGPYTFQWSNTQTGATAEGLPAGEHGVTVTDANGCQAETTFTLGEPAVLEAGLGTTLVTCSGTPDGTATANPTGGTPPYSFEWSDGSGHQTATATGLTVGDVTVTVTDANGCTYVDTVFVAGTAAISLSFNTTDVSCFEGSDGRIEAAAEGGSGVYNYDWGSANLPDTPNPGNLPAGVYQLTVTDQSGCTAEGEVTISQPTRLVLDADPQHLACAGIPEGAIDLRVNGGVTPYAYEWSNALNVEDPADLPAGNYAVTVTDANGCTATLEAPVNEPPALESTFEVEEVDCFGEATGALEVTVRGGVGNYDYQWSNGLTGTQIENLPAGTYSLSITDANGCLLVQEVNLPQPEAPVAAQVTAEGVSCYGFRDGRITVEASGGTPFYLYSLDGAEFTSSPVFIGLEPDEYNLRVQDVKGCIWEDSQVTVTEPDPVVVDLGPDITIEYGATASLRAEVDGGVSPFEFVWTPADSLLLSCLDCPDPVVNTLEQRSFLVEVTDANGCEGEDRITLFVTKERLVFVPTGFSPNGDGSNDRLLVHGESGTRIRLFRVFDRWGELLFELSDFEVNDVEAGWDGAFRGQPVEGGVYIWQIEVEYPDGSTEVLSGGTTLLR